MLPSSSSVAFALSLVPPGTYRVLYIAALLHVYCTPTPLQTHGHIATARRYNSLRQLTL